MLKELKNIFTIRAIVFTLTLLCLQVIVGIAIIYLTFINQTRETINRKISQIHQDIQHVGNSWDLSIYNADPLLLGVYPLYIFTTDGFILDRRDPITGFYDTSNFKNLLSYQKPQTVTSITNQERRLISKPLIKDGEVVGVITVSYFNPQKELLTGIDNKLQQALAYIASNINVKDSVIDASKVDSKYLGYDISFIIVDKYNVIIKKTTNVNNINRIPNVIDASYVKLLLNHVPEQFVLDAKTHEPFFTISSVITNEQKNPIAVIVVGESILLSVTLLKNFIVWDLSLGVILSILLITFFKKTSFLQFRRNFPVLTSIIFNERKGVLYIGNQKIKISYASNQYYFLQALFNNPLKRWEIDELLKKFGEGEVTKKNSKMIYDTMLTINEKVKKVISVKLILNQNRTYLLNPEITFSH